MKTSRIIAALLALLGFAGCDGNDGGDNDDGGGMVLMYGTLPVSFVVKGAVTDADDKPLENIRVVLRVRDDETEQPGMKGARDTVYTDAKGEFETNTHNRNYLRWALHAEDIDGAENGGEFRSETKEFSVSDRNYDPGEGMYIEEIDFALTETDAADEDE